MEAVFPDGKPLRINREDFRRQFLTSFPKLAGLDKATSTEADNIIDTSIEAVYDIFTGVATLWNLHDKQTWFDKTRRCYLYLTAWYIADMYPKYVAGVSVMGAIPLKEKKIGGVDIKFDTDFLSSGKGQNLLRGLLSNPFGKMAYTMITCCAKRTALR
jgi:hypothetical protein